MKKIISAAILIVVYMVFLCGASLAASEPNLPGWYWISSDDKYSKYFATDKVKTDKFYRNIPTRITAVTRTGYTLAGAKETLNNYNITSITPEQLKYSIAEVQVDPQNRTIAYIREVFYDKNNNPIWSKQYGPIKTKEINSQQFDEAFYNNIVDSVFGMGEDVRSKAADRWYGLWEKTSEADEHASSIADTTTMHMIGDNLYYWEWREFKDSTGKVKRIRFQKKAMNLRQSTVKVLGDQIWTPEKGWVDQSANLKRYYTAITKGSDDAQSLKKLRRYAKTHKSWVYRYQLKQ